MNSVVGNYSVKSNYQQLAFKGKPNTKDLKKMFQPLEELQLRTYLSDPRIPKFEKQETIMREMNAKFFKIFNESKLKDILKNFKK